MTIYEIDQKIEELLNAVDLETGELVTDYDLLEQLQMERDQKCENLALAIKEYKAQANAIADEIKALTDRKRLAEKALERASNYLEYVLQGNPYKSARVDVSFRKTPPRVVLEDDFMKWAKNNAPRLIKTVEPCADLTAIKEAIKQGADVPFARLETSIKMNVR